MEPMCPIIPSPRDIIDKIFMLEYFSDLTFQKLISNTFFHINNHGSSFKLIDLRSNRKWRIMLNIPKKWT